MRLSGARERRLRGATVSAPDELYVLARHALLDALTALGEHRQALILVGAQAVYLRVGESDLAVAPFTTDGDLAVDPSLLQQLPPLEQVLTRAGFAPQRPDSIGIWITQRQMMDQTVHAVAIDLLVPESVSPRGGRRAANLRGHDRRAARIVRGIEGALVDSSIMTLAALTPGDARTLDVRVAGPAALVVAKVHKIDDRKDSERLSDKDALDVLRLLQGTTTSDLAHRYARLLADERSRDAATRGRVLLERQFASPRGTGVEMARRAVGMLADPEQVSASLVALSGDLLERIGTS